jgi:hypothetical protein
MPLLGCTEGPVDGYAIVMARHTPPPRSSRGSEVGDASCSATHGGLIGKYRFQYLLAVYQLRFAQVVVIQIRQIENIVIEFFALRLLTFGGGSGIVLKSRLRR